MEGGKRRPHPGELLLNALYNGLSCSSGGNRVQSPFGPDLRVLPWISLFVLDCLDDVRAGSGAGGEEASEDPDQESGEDREERRQSRVVEGDLEAVGAGALDEEVAQEGAYSSAYKAPDEAYNYAFVYDEAAYL